MLYQTSTCLHKLHDGKRVLPIENFLFDKRTNNYGSPCKLCMSKINAIWRHKNKDKLRIKSKNYYDKNKEKILAGGKKYRRTSRKGTWRNIKKRGTDFKDFNEFISFMNSTPDVCVYCGIPENLIIKGYFRTARLTIDRMDNTKKYEKNNITKACPDCNRIKNDIFTFDEMCEIGKKYLKPKWKNRSINALSNGR